jgi:HAD superfamily hydrolase (TIGR01490 family)
LVATAFFDFDGTLLTKESGVICAVPALRSGLLGAGAGARVIGTYVLSKMRLRTRTDAQLAGFRCYEGKSLGELRDAMRSLHASHMRRHVCPDVRERLDGHRARGDRLVILTASAFFFAEPLGAELGAEVVGTQVGFTPAGVCTGLVDGKILDGDAKLAAARAVDAKLDACTFYTDHIADLPLLEAVGKPVVVRPRRDLAKLARARGWEAIPADRTG